LYCWEDEVEITGIVTSLGLDTYNVEQFDLEVQTIKKLVPDSVIHNGKIIYGYAPSLTLPPPSSETVLAIVAPENFCFYNYVLTINNEWIQDDVLFFEGVMYAVGDEVEIIGVTFAKENDYATKYVELEIEAINKITNVESLPINNFEVYYNTINQIIVIDGMPQNQTFTFELLDVQGNVVLREPDIRNKRSISVANLLSGIYLYRFIQDGHVIKTDKLLVDK
jgi:hypothetical protein